MARNLIRNIQRGADGRHDLVTSGSDQLIGGRRAASLSVVYRLRMIRGEDFMNVSNGTPWFTDILGKVDQSSAETIIRQQILASPAVAGITDFDYNFDRHQHQITVSATILSVDGDLVSVAFTAETF